jgi:hypothetical protein
VCSGGDLTDLEKLKNPCRHWDLNPSSFSRDNAVTVITTLTVTTTLTVITTPSRLVYFLCKKFVVRDIICTYSSKVYCD